MKPDNELKSTENVKSQELIENLKKIIESKNKELQKLEDEKKAHQNSVFHLRINTLATILMTIATITGPMPPTAPARATSIPVVRPVLPPELDPDLDLNEPNNQPSLNDISFSIINIYKTNIKKFNAGSDKLTTIENIDTLLKALNNTQVSEENINMMNNFYIDIEKNINLLSDCHITNSDIDIIQKNDSN